MNILHEFENTVKHFITGLIVGAAALIIFPYEYSGILFSALTGFGVESYQLLYKSEPWWIIDRAFDLFGYCLGGAVATIIFISMRWV